MTEGMPRLILRLEGLALFASAIAAYGYLGHSWWMFIILLFVPDLSMAGYLAGPKIGGLAYNVWHTTVLPLALAVGSTVLVAPLLTAIALIWLAHIGMDRMIGYGLKYPSDFKNTHLGRIGRA